MSLHRPCPSIVKFNPVPLRRRDRYRQNPPLKAAKLDAIGLQFRNQLHGLLGEDHRLLNVIAPLLSIHERICKQQSKFDNEVRRLAKSDRVARPDARAPRKKIHICAPG